ncbi:hypothetical protein TYRP_019846 [Tyrophagus putrescentiae]|nr:hypothetical protein TYRP_019846 [Tyrophagus putrescentiae]
MIFKTFPSLLQHFILFLSFITTTFSHTLESPESQEQKSSSSSNLPRLLIFSFDGFRADALSASVTPTLYSLAATGVTGHMRPTFPSKTFPNHHSIATGLYQPYHGVVNNKFIDPTIVGSLEGTNQEKFSVDNGSAFWWDMYDRNVPLYIANQVFEPERRFSGALQWPGAISTYTGGFDTCSQFSRTLNWTAAIDHVVDRWLLSPFHPANLVLLYFHEPDSTSHEFGPFSRQVRQKLVKLDQMVAYFLDRLHEEGLDTSTNLLFISDHGMTEITPSRVITLDRCAEVLGPGLSYRLVGVSPVFSIVPLSAPEEFFPKSSGSNLTSAVQSALNHCSRRLFNGKFTVYQQAEIPPEYHYSGNRRILDLLLLAEDGYEVKYTKNDGKRIPRGNHGFNNSLPSMRPLFIGHGPAFKSGGGGYHHEKCSKINGSLERVAGLLRGGGGVKKGDDNDNEEIFEGDFEEETEEELHFRLHIQRQELAELGGQQRFVTEVVLFVVVLSTMIFLCFVVCLTKLSSQQQLRMSSTLSPSNLDDDPSQAYTIIRVKRKLVSTSSSNERDDTSAIPGYNSSFKRLRHLGSFTASASASASTSTSIPSTSAPPDEEAIRRNSLLKMGLSGQKRVRFSDLNQEQFSAYVETLGENENEENRKKRKADFASPKEEEEAEEKSKESSNTTVTTTCNGAVLEEVSSSSSQNDQKDFENDPQYVYDYYLMVDYVLSFEETKPKEGTEGDDLWDADSNDENYRYNDYPDEDEFDSEGDSSSGSSRSATNFGFVGSNSEDEDEGDEREAHLRDIDSDQDDYLGEGGGRQYYDEEEEGTTSGFGTWSGG